MKTTTMTISTRKGGPSVEVSLRVPRTPDDWRTFYNVTPAERDAKALRQIRVDIANGGARDVLRKAIDQGLSLSDAKDVVQDWVLNWRAGTRSAQVTYVDLSKVPALSLEQLQAMVASVIEQGHQPILSEEQTALLETASDDESDEDDN